MFKRFRLFYILVCFICFKEMLVTHELLYSYHKLDNGCLLSLIYLLSLYPTSAVPIVNTADLEGAVCLVRDRPRKKQEQQQISTMGKISSMLLSHKTTVVQIKQSGSHSSVFSHEKDQRPVWRLLWISKVKENTQLKPEKRHVTDCHKSYNREQKCPYLHNLYSHIISYTYIALKIKLMVKYCTLSALQIIHILLYQSTCWNESTEIN